MRKGIKMTQDELAFLGSAPPEVMDFIDTHENVHVLDPGDWHELHRFDFGGSFINGDGDADSEWSGFQIGSTTYLCLVHTKDGHYVESFVVATPIVDGKPTRSGGFDVARGKVQVNLHAENLPNVMMEMNIPGWNFTNPEPGPEPGPSGDCVTQQQLTAALQPIINGIAQLQVALAGLPVATINYMDTEISTPGHRLNLDFNNNAHNAAGKAILENHLTKVGDFMAGGNSEMYRQAGNEIYLFTWDILYDQGITTQKPPNRQAPGVSI